jgi:PAS fold
VARRRIGEVLSQIDAGSIERSLRRVLATGTPVDDLEVSSRPSGPIRERIWSCIQFRIDGPDGKPAGAAHIMREVTGYAIDQRRLALADEASTRIGTTLEVTRTAEELLEVAIPRLADVGAVDLLATVIEGDHLSRRPRDGKMRLRRVALRWPVGVPAPPDYTRHTWRETDPAELNHRCLVTGSPVYLPAFGAMTPERIRDAQADAGLSRMLAARGESPLDDDHSADRPRRRGPFLLAPRAAKPCPRLVTDSHGQPGRLTPFPSRFQRGAGEGRPRRGAAQECVAARRTQNLPVIAL